MKLRKKIILMFSILSASLIYYVVDRFSYAKEEDYFEVNNSIKNERNQIKIGIIGDSWVAGKKIDSLLHNQLIKKGIKSEILSSGQPGARSKTIYQNLFYDERENFSSRFILINNPDYCVVISGVNDSASQIGASNYSYHVIKIIETLLHYNIKPIIVSLPEFDIENTTKQLNIFSKSRNIITSEVNNSGEIDNIETYKNKLLSDVNSLGLMDAIIYIDFDNVCEDYANCDALYENSAHLSMLGNSKLSAIISNEISKIKLISL